MLGWFSKKFKKQAPEAPREDGAPLEEPQRPQETQSLPEKLPVAEPAPAGKISSAEAPVPEQEDLPPEGETAATAQQSIKSRHLTADKKVPVPSPKGQQTDRVTRPELADALPPEQEKAPCQPDTLKPEPHRQPEDIGQSEQEPAPVQPEDAPEPTLAEEEKPLRLIKQTDVQKQPAKKKSTLFSRLTERLGKTRETFTYQMDALFLGKKEIDAEMLDDLEEILISADLGVGTTQDLLETARRKVKRKEMYDPKSLKKMLKVQIQSLIAGSEQDAALVMPETGPFVIMVIGVNGVGKTTTIGKIAKKFQQSGSSVMLVAADTFRAAAVAQLKIWGERCNVPVVAHKEGADPSSVVFDALGIAQKKNIDVVLVDTAGRMHTKDNLMEELKKIKRVMGKKLPGAPHEVMLVIDATTGQNGISQAQLFNDAVGVTGITLTKLDGTSKGGIVANISKEMKIPIRFIGIGEKTADLRDFDAAEFVDALFHSRTNQAEQ